MEEMDATGKEPTPEEMKSVAEQQEVPKEKAVIQTVGAQEDRS
jgi:hypothetical protein